MADAEENAEDGGTIRKGEGEIDAEKRGSGHWGSGRGGWVEEKQDYS